MEMQHGYWGTFALMIIGLLGALWLETGLLGAPLALLFIFLAIVIGAVVLIALKMQYDWAWNLALGYFALLLLNAGFVFTGVTNHIIAFAIASIAPLFGLMLSLMHVSEPIEHVVPVETAASAPKKRGRPKKS